MDTLGLVTALFVVLNWVVLIGFSFRVIMRRRPVGASLAWLIVIATIPFLGAALYLLIGENRIGEKRAERVVRLRGPFESWLDSLARRSVIDWSTVGPACQSLHRQAAATIGIPALGGNRVELIDDCEQTLRQIIADIDNAQRTCHLEFYIWSEGGTADEVAEALIRAAQRGVICRVLVDAVGSKKFLRSRLAQKMRDRGVDLKAALPVGLLRMLFVRLDLRLHRKIVVIDGQIAFTGSQNLADARYFKKGAGFGKWIDAMVRIRGPAVEALAVTFLADWEIETGVGIDALRKTGDVQELSPQGSSNVQVVPSGPGGMPQAIFDMLLTTVYTAQTELIMTTPYFVPGEAILTAIKNAALRGVQVTIIIPAKVDSPLVRLASRSSFEELLAAGVQIKRFRAGLLHSKTISVDGEFGLIGSGNLDMRSFWLNFEVTLFVYDPQFASTLRQTQVGYVAQSEPIDLQAWRERPVAIRFMENVARLLSPLL